MRYLGTHVSTAGGVACAPLRAGEIGCNTIQIFAKNNNQWLSKKPLVDEEIRSYQKNRVTCGIEIAFSHAGYLINLASPDAKNHSLSMQSLTQELERGDQLKLQFVVLHPGAHVGTGVDKGIKKIAESINSLFDSFKELNTVLLLENTAGQGSSIGHRFEELAAIIDRVEEKGRIGVCLDTCHAFAAGYDLRNPEGYLEMWESFERIIGLNKLKAIHLNDSRKGLASRVDRHEHIGLGEIGDEGFRLLMRDERFKKIPMVLETPKLDNPRKYDLMNIQRLLSLEKE